MLLCDAAGFDTILVESVGVGQSEITLRSMVDIFILLMLPGAGDELQGIKKGIVEISDLVLINKSDGDRRLAAELAKADQDAVLHYLQPATPGWKTATALVSGLTGDGLPRVWELIESFYSDLAPKGVIAARRRRQTLEWLDALVRDESCGGHFRTEHQTPEGEAVRNDQDFAFVSAWQYTGDGNMPNLVKEPLVYEQVKLSTRSYK
jgi:LAO/AO transport system kinase